MPEVKRQRRHEKIKKNKLSFKQHSSTFHIWYYWGKFIGVNPLSLSEDNKLKFSYKALFYGCFLISFYCYIACRALFERVYIFLPSETPIAIIVDNLRIGCQCLNGSTTWFVFAFYQNRMKLIVKSFVNVEKISRNLGIPDDYEKLFKELGSYLTVHNVLCIGSLLLSEILWSYILNFDRSTWVVFNIWLIAPYNMFILFVWCLILVKQKYNRLNDKVRHLMKSENRNVDQTIGKRRQGLIIINPSCNTKHQQDTINTVSLLHHDLRITIHRIESYFAPIVLLNIASNFIFMILATYRLYRYMKEHGPLGEMAFAFLGAVSHHLIYPAVMIIIISNICGSIADKANDTSNMLHAMINDCNTICDTRMTEQFNVIFLDLLQNQVSMSVYGLFKLDHFLVYSIVASVTNYVTIMLQLQE